MTIELVRPSSLPKLAHCRCYVNSPGTSEAAERGTRIDSLIRASWGTPGDIFINDTPENAEAVNFALSTLKLLSCGQLVETREEELRAVVPVDGVKAGVMDALCVAGGWLADFKTGQVRDYEAQMAAYSLACMDAYFAEEWTSHLIFVDQKFVVSRNWTREEAERLILGIVNAPMVPTPFENCSWCGAFESCPAVRTATAEVTPELPALKATDKSEISLPPALEGMLADHAAAHEFLGKLRIVNDWADLLKKQLLAQLEDGTSEHFTRVVVSGSKKVSPAGLAEKVGAEKVLGICSLLPLKKAEELWREACDEPMPDALVTSTGGSVQLKLKTIKKSLNNN